MENVLNVMMLGGRRCGKTSVLASMLNCYSKVVRDTGMKIEPESGTAKVLEDKLESLENELFSYSSETFTIDEKSTYDINTYSFRVTADSKKITVNFTDIPGEYFSDGINDENVENIISNSNIVIIAIDTVHMMEEDRRFSEVYNRTGVITNWMKNSDFTATKNPKLVLLVPLKCETYYHENRMDEVNRRVKDEYMDLLSFLSCDALKDKFTVAITPILTVGNVIFDRFGRDETGRIIVHQNAPDSTRYRPVYTYFKYRCPDAKFEPLYCEQPFLYIMSFIVRLYDVGSSKGGKLGVAAKIAIVVVSTILFGIAGGALSLKMIMSMRSVSVNLRREGDGYEILQNPVGI